jgi:hypothetical protein
VIAKVPLTGHPNNISIGKDGRRVYVSIAVAPGAVDVIDTLTLQRVKSIPNKERSTTPTSHRMEIRRRRLNCG